VKLPHYTLVHRRRAPGAALEHAGGAPVAEAVAPANAGRRVGVWDLGAYVGKLPAIVELLNQSQAEYVFYETLAAPPVGIISQPERVRAWVKQLTGRTGLRDVAQNVIAADFFARAERVRKDLALEYLAGITARLVADEDDQDVEWNLFSTYRGRLVLVSSAELREYAQKARCPYEYAVAGVVVAQLLVAVHPRLDFHDDRGCLFDRNDDRAGIVRVLKDPKIEDSCLKLMKPAGRPAALAIVEALRRYARGGGS
jgi:hypothetical protein